MKIRNVLSLFDGISCGQVALEREGIDFDKYYASELDKFPIKITQANYPDTIQLGDVCNWQEWDIDWSKVDLLIGGSPCQGFSFAGKQLAFDDPRSKLFFVYVDILNHIRKFNPNVKFMLENVKMKKDFLDVISDHLGVEPVFINSALVSAQNRQRYYWANWEFAEPEDKGVFLKDVIENGFVDRDKSLCIDSNYFKGGNLKQYFEKHRRQLVFSSEGLVHIGNADIKGNESIKRVYHIEGKSPCLTTMGGGHREPKILCGAMRGRHLVNGIRKDGQGKAKQYIEVRADYKTNCLSTVQKDNLVVICCAAGKRYEINDLIWRKLTPIECERLQTLPDNYTNHVSNTQRYKALGNGWTVDVIAHIFKGIKNDQ